MSGLTCFVSTPSRKCSYISFFAENTLTDIVYPDMLEKVFLLIAHAMLFQLKSGPPLFTLHFRWDISEAALTFNGLVPLNLKHLFSSVGNQIGMLLTFPHFPTFRRNCCEDWTGVTKGYSIHTDKCVK